MSPSTLKRLKRWGRVVVGALPTFCALVGLRALSLLDAPGEAPEPPREFVFGPGWFDSSWDLRAGLDIREGLPADANINEWLDVCLRA